MDHIEPPLWDALRCAEFPVTRKWAYLDHAALAPLPQRAANVIRAWVDEQVHDGVVGWPDRDKRLENVRDQVARLIHAGRDEVAFISSTTHGIGLVAEGFPWNAGDSVVTAAEEYPSNLYPWMNLESRGVGLRLVPTRAGRVWIDDLIAAVDHSTRMITISHVEFSSGFRNDLDAIGAFCRERGIAFFVDAIQGLGPLEIDVARTPIDFMAADGHKWLLGPEGAGILYVRREWIERLRPIGVGWRSVVGSYNPPAAEFRLKPGADRWEGGTLNMAGLLALGASVGLILEIGPAAVSRRALELAEGVRAAAAAAGWTIHGSEAPRDRSAIVVLERPGVDPDKTARDLRLEGVVVSCRRGRLRVSPHFYNNEADLERLERGLSAAPGSSRHFIS